MLVTVIRFRKRTIRYTHQSTRQPYKGRKFQAGAGLGPIIRAMTCWTCRSSTLAELSKAMAKSAAARLRRIGALSAADDWARRAEVCERCPLRVVQRGVSYCGQPFLQKMDREDSVDGCGCPTREKAKSPAEHCPLDVRNRPAQTVGGTCTCKWCAMASAQHPILLNS